MAAPANPLQQFGDFLRGFSALREMLGDDVFAEKIAEARSLIAEVDEKLEAAGLADDISKLHNQAMADRTNAAGKLANAKDEATDILVNARAVAKALRDNAGVEADAILAGARRNALAAQKKNRDAVALKDREEKLMKNARQLDVEARALLARGSTLKAEYEHKLSELQEGIQRSKTS